MAYLRANPVLVLIAAYLLSAFALHRMEVADIFPPCIVAKVLGRPCPGCGLTRAALALFRLEFRTAWRFNPGIFIVLPLLVCFMIAHVRSFYRRRTVQP